MASNLRRRKNRLSTLPHKQTSPVVPAPDTSAEPLMSPAGTPMGSAHRDVPKPAPLPSCHPDGSPFTRERPGIDPATGEVMGGWVLPDNFDQRPQPEPDEAQTPPEPEPQSRATIPAEPAPRPKRDTRLDGLNALQRTHARANLDHLPDVVGCQCDRCWQKRGSVHKSPRGVVGRSRGGESAASWNHRNDERPTGSASEQIQEVIDTEF